jgi:hypothetical protein
MLNVLKSMPGVSEPTLRYVTSDGYTYPVLEYRADEKARWVQPTRFVALKPYHGKYQFQAMLPGAIDPDIGHPDAPVTGAIIERWKERCRADAIILFE